MQEVQATLSWSLDVECPYCGHEVDLSDNDDESVYAKAIFNNDWDKLKDTVVTCPKCATQYKIREVIY